ncbi:hypothetical protein Tco_0300595 [Tanacetum coccineum]
MVHSFGLQLKNGVTRTKKYAELSAAEKIQVDCDMKATNIILQGLLADIYFIVNHRRVSKDLWEKVQLLMQGTSESSSARVIGLDEVIDLVMVEIGLEKAAVKTLETKVVKAPSQRKHATIAALKSISLVVSKPSSSNYDLNYIDLQKENEELLKFNKDFTKKLLKEKCSLENENSKLSCKINDLELEVKKLVNNKEVVEPCQKCVELTQKVDSLKGNVSKLQDEALNFSKFKESSISLDDMLRRQKLSQDKEGLGFSKSDKTTSASPNKPIVFVKQSKKEIVSTSFVKPVVPQTYFVNTRGHQAPITRDQGYYSSSHNGLGYTQPRVDLKPVTTGNFRNFK